MTTDRHSQASDADLIEDPELKARKELSNGLQLTDEMLSVIETALEAKESFKLRPSQILALHRTSLDGINRYAGNYRPAGVEIFGSFHEPIDAKFVPREIEVLCEYVNKHWTWPAIHLAAYVLWRLNWIHPFADGNGRTARAVAYVVLCIRAGLRLPGINTVPEQIAKNKKPYYDALEAADAALKRDELDLSEMERYLGDLFANQLAALHAQAKSFSGVSSQ